MKKIIIGIVCSLSLVLTGCHKKLPQISNESKIVAFGDSLTYGYGAGDEQAYPQQLEKIIGYKVINAGLNGDTASAGKTRLRNIVEEYNPQVVIIGLGGNDMLRGSAQELKTNLEEMIFYLQGKNITPILLAEPQPSILGATLGLKDAEVYENVSKTTGVYLLSGIYSKHLSKQEFKSDMIHLNAKGYRLVAEDIANELKNSGLIK